MSNLVIANIGLRCVDSQGKAISMLEKIHTVCAVNGDSDEYIGAKEEARPMFYDNYPNSIPCL
jgi:hypothetical protein